MDPRQRPTGRHFLIRPLEVERIRALKGEPYMEERLRRARTSATALVREPLEMWDASISKNAWIHTGRFRELLNAATLHLVTGEEEWAQAVRRDVMTAVKVSEATYERFLSTDYIQETIVHRTILFANEWLCEFFTDDDRRRIKETCLQAMPHHAWEMARSTVNRKLIQNHILLDSVGTAMVMLYYNDFIDADRWGHFAGDTAVQYMRDAFHPDGAQNELATTYHTLCIDIGLLLSQVLRDFGHRDLMREDWFRRVMERGVDWLASLATPTGNVVAFNDSGDRVGAWYFRFGASQFGRPHFQALANLAEPATGGENLLHDLLYYEPSIPARFDATARSIFPVSGTAVVRTGYTPQDGLVAQKVGSYIGGHAHLDRLGFEWWNKGKVLMQDPGGHKGDWTLFVGWYKETSCHNVVAIHEPHEEPVIKEEKQDGTFQKLHRGHRKAQGRIVHTQEDADHGIIVSRANIYDDVRQKRILVWLKKSGVLLVADEVEADREYPLDQLFHGFGELGVEDRAFTYNAPGASVAASILGPAEVKIHALPTPKGATGAATYAAVRVQGSRVFFITLLEPFEGKRPPVRKLDAAGELKLPLAGVTLALSTKKDGLAIRVDGREVWPASAESEKEPRHAP